MKKYNLFDIVVFGSYLTGKDYPKDIDICLILGKEDMELITNIKREIEKIIEYPMGLEFIFLKDLYINSIWRTLEREGFSIRKNRFLRDILGLKPYLLYTYELKHLKQWQKVRFSQVLNRLLKEFNGEKLGLGTFMVPREYSGYIIEFFENWKIKYNAKWIDIIR